MSEVKRYARMGELVESNAALLKLYPAMTVYVLASDFDRVTAERDALQLLLNAADQRVDVLERVDARYRWLQKATPYRFKKIQDASVTDGGNVLYFHADRFDAAVDAALKPAEAAVEYGPTPGCKQCEEAESCGFTDCPECDAQLCEDVNGDGFRPGYKPTWSR